MFTVNEIVHEHRRFQIEDTGVWCVTYEPLENLPVASLAGRFHFPKKKKPLLSFAGVLTDSPTVYYGKILDQTGKLIGTYDSSTGTIQLVSHKVPPEHSLIVSYYFGEDSMPKPNKPVNWKNEGF